MVARVPQALKRQLFHALQEIALLIVLDDDVQWGAMLRSGRCWMLLPLTQQQHISFTGARRDDLRHAPAVWGA